MTKDEAIRESLDAYQEMLDEARQAARQLFRLFLHELDEADWLLRHPWLIEKPAGGDAGGPDDGA